LKTIQVPPSNQPNKGCQTFGSLTPHVLFMPDSLPLWL